MFITQCEETEFNELLYLFFSFFKCVLHFDEGLKLELHIKHIQYKHRHLLT